MSKYSGYIGLVIAGGVALLLLLFVAKAWLISQQPDTPSSEVTIQLKAAVGADTVAARQATVIAIAHHDTATGFAAAGRRASKAATVLHHQSLKPHVSVPDSITTHRDSVRFYQRLLAN